MSLVSAGSFPVVTGMKGGSVIEEEKWGGKGEKGTIEGESES